jgi:cobalt-zinc-cadmium resistance protein CzcA
VPGVIDVDLGRQGKTFDITVDLDKLLAYGITLKQVLDALNGANIKCRRRTVSARSRR